MTPVNPVSNQTIGGYSPEARKKLTHAIFYDALKTHAVSSHIEQDDLIKGVKLSSKMISVHQTGEVLGEAFYSALVEVERSEEDIYQIVPTLRDENLKKTYHSLFRMYANSIEDIFTRSTTFEKENPLQRLEFKFEIKITSYKKTVNFSKDLKLTFFE